MVLTEMGGTILYCEKASNTVTHKKLIKENLDFQEGIKRRLLRENEN